MKYLNDFHDLMNEHKRLTQGVQEGGGIFVPNSELVRSPTEPEWFWNGRKLSESLSYEWITNRRTLDGLRDIWIRFQLELLRDFPEWERKLEDRQHPPSMIEQHYKWVYEKILKTQQKLMLRNDEIDIEIAEIRRDLLRRNRPSPRRPRQSRRNRKTKFPQNHTRKSRKTRKKKNRRK